mmetsp:Transcript_24680/g.30205  ORF Transcript_24680/g.30205 Transcript_24680/m.30205 type:complete len:100 (+) Transcript_24680:962-1261(+)
MDPLTSFRLLDSPRFLPIPRSRDSVSFPKKVTTSSKVSVVFAADISGTFPLAREENKDKTTKTMAEYFLNTFIFSTLFYVAIGCEMFLCTMVTVRMDVM